MCSGARAVRAEGTTGARRPKLEAEVVFRKWRWKLCSNKEAGFWVAPPASISNSPRLHFLAHGPSIPFPHTASTFHFLAAHLLPPPPFPRGGVRPAHTADGGAARRGARPRGARYGDSGKEPATERVHHDWLARSSSQMSASGVVPAMRRHLISLRASLFLDAAILPPMAPMVSMTPTASPNTVNIFGAQCPNGYFASDGVPGDASDLISCPGTKPIAMHSPTQVPCFDVTLTTTGDHSAKSWGPFTIAGYGTVPPSCHDAVGNSCTLRVCDTARMQTLMPKHAGAFW
eukprot:gene47381-biopygen120709